MPSIYLQYYGRVPYSYYSVIKQLSKDLQAYFTYLHHKQRSRNSWGQILSKYAPLARGVGEGGLAVRALFDALPICSC